ncbi:MAG: ATP-binding cassette domain-containing protein [Clostridia bacterium]|nr:ATP-binding cassette domain-containing protein [Clostridia bacterium]
MIKVSNLTKRYGSFTALDNVSFTVDEGTVTGFLGPNGAGKSTTMNIITGYLSATEGTVEISGKDILEDANEAKKLIGYLPEIPPLYTDMTVKEYLSFMYDLKKVKLNKKEHIKEICEITKIDGVYGRLIGNLSKGYRQRVGIAQALLGNPPVLILDEPTVGLDPTQIIEIRNLIAKLGKNHTVILSSHILSEIQAVCDRILVINQGKLVADGTADSLAHDLSDEHTINVRIMGPEVDVVTEIRKIKGVVRADRMGTKEAGTSDYRIETEENADIRVDLFNMASRMNWPILSLGTSELTLEQVFLKLTSTDTVHISSEEGGEE